MLGKNTHVFEAQTKRFNNTDNKEATTKYLDLGKLENYLLFSVMIILETQVLEQITVCKSYSDTLHN